MTTVRHHVHDETLLAYAAGELQRSACVLVATHLALCPACRRKVSLAEEIGGALVEDMAPVAMNDDALDSVMSRLDGAVIEAPRRPGASACEVESPVLPEPLRGLIGGDAGSIRWRRIGPGVRQCRLDDKSGPGSMRLLRIAGGVGVPEHGHNGEEMTLVLSGGFTDAGQSFVRGDVECADQDDIHRPVADPGGDCICLAVTTAPLRFFDVIGRLAQPLIGI